MKLNYLKLIHLNDAPSKVAFGFAVGAFIGVFPTFGLGGLMVIALCYIFRLSYAGAVAGAVIVMNPLASPFFWTLSAWVGSIIFSKDTDIIISAIRSKTVFNYLGDITLIYLAGNTIVSTIVAVLSYFIVKKIITLKRKQQVR